VAEQRLAYAGQCTVKSRTG